MLRRLAEGVAEAHRVGLAVGGLTPEHVVLRPNGLVGLRGVPAAPGTVYGDITALGALLELCLTGPGPGPRRPPAAQPPRPRRAGPPRPLHRAGPGPVQRRRHGLAARRASPHRPGGPPGQRRTGRRPDTDAAGCAGSAGRTPARRTPSPTRRPTDAPARAPPSRPATAPVDVPCRGRPGGVPPAAVPPARWRLLAPRRPPPRPAPRRLDAPGATHALGDERTTGLRRRRLGTTTSAPYRRVDLDERTAPPAARRLGLPLLALAVVIGLALWFGSSVLSVAGSVTRCTGPPPGRRPRRPALHARPRPSAGRRCPSPPPRCSTPTATASRRTPRKVPLSYDGDPGDGLGHAAATRARRTSATSSPASASSTTSAAPSRSAGVTHHHHAARRHRRDPHRRPPPTARWTPSPSPAPPRSTPPPRCASPRPVTTRYVLVWFTGLVPDSGSFSANLAEVAIHARPAEPAAPPWHGAAGMALLRSSLCRP